MKLIKKNNLIYIFFLSLVLIICGFFIFKNQYNVKAENDVVVDYVNVVSSENEFETNYTITFITNKKSCVIKPITVENGSYIELPVAVVNSFSNSKDEIEPNYEFLGWTCNGEEVSNQLCVNSDMTLSANWLDLWTLYY